MGQHTVLAFKHGDYYVCYRRLWRLDDLENYVFRIAPRSNIELILSPEPKMVEYITNQINLGKIKI